MVAKRRLNAFYWQGTSASGSWIQFIKRTYNSSTNVYDAVSPAVSSVINAAITDKLGAPMTCNLTISNSAADPFIKADSNSSGLSATADPASLGPYTNVVKAMDRIYVEDGETHQIYFYGAIEDVNYTHQAGIGQVINIKARDYLQEIKNKSTVGTYGYKRDKTADVHLALEKTSAKDADEEVYETALGGNSGILKSIITHHSANITSPGNTNAGDISSAADPRFNESLTNHNVTAADNNHFDMSSGGPTSILTRISQLAAQDTHTANTATSEETFGFDYYVDPNFTDASVSNVLPKAYFNYFKRGTRPSASPTYIQNTGGATDGDSTYGLTIKHPSRNETSSGGFLETGQRQPLFNGFFKRQKFDTYTIARASYKEFVVPEGGEDGKGGTVLSGTDSADFMYVRAGTINNVNNTANVFKMGYLTGDNGNIEESEWLNASISTVASTIADTSSDTSCTVSSNVTMYIGQILLIDSEYVKVKTLTGTTTVVVYRNQNNPYTGAAGAGTAAHSASATIHATKVAKIQYMNKTEASTGDFSGSTTADMLISHIDVSLLDATENPGKLYWTTSSPRTWTGSVSGSTFVFTYTPLETTEYQNPVMIDTTNEESTENAVKRIMATLQRRTESTIRGSVMTYRPPRFYFEDSPASVDKNYDSVSGQDRIDLSGSKNPRNYGFMPGMVANKLDSNGNATGEYLYANSVTTSQVIGKWDSGSGLTDGDEEDVRFYVPVRAGDLVKIKDQTNNVDQPFLISKVSYDEGDGFSLTRYDLAAAEDAKAAAGAEYAPQYADASSAESFTKSFPTEFLNESAVMTFDIESKTATSVNWTGGTVWIGTKKYENIAAGSNGSLTLGTVYKLYYTKGSRVLILADETSWESLVKYRKNIRLIATISAVEPQCSIIFAQGVSGKQPDRASTLKVIGEKVSFSSDVEGSSGYTISAINMGSGLNATDTAITVDDVDGTYKFHRGQKIKIDNEVMFVSAVNNSTNVVTVRARKNGVTHADDAVIKGEMLHGRFEPQVLHNTPTLRFNGQAIGGSGSGYGVVTNYQTMDFGVEIGASVTSGQRIHGAVFWDSLEMASSSTSANRIFFARDVDDGDGDPGDNVISQGSIFMSGSFFYIDDAATEGYSGVVPNFDTDTYLRFEGSNVMSLRAGGNTALTVNANGSLTMGTSNMYFFAQGGYSWAGDPDSYITSVSDYTSFYQGSYRSFYAHASSASDGVIAVQNAYTFIGDVDTKISSSSNTLQFWSGGNVAATMLATSDSDGAIYAERYYTWRDDINTHIQGASDVMTFTTGGDSRLELNSNGAELKNGSDYWYAPSGGGYTWATDTDTGFNLQSADLLNIITNNSIRIQVGAQSIGVTKSDGSTQNVSVVAEISGGIITNNTSSSYFASVRPIADDTYSLGGGFYRWDNVYATNATIQTSDVREKENINDTKLGLDFLKDLRPVSYEWKKKKDNKTNQTHYGLIAQEVVESLKQHGIDSIEDFGGIVHEGDPKGLYGARYEEFVPILIKAVQELSEEIKQLKEDQ